VYAYASSGACCSCGKMCATYMCRDNCVRALVPLYVCSDGRRESAMAVVLTPHGAMQLRSQTNNKLRLCM
jgi:hypothetical protein